MTNFIKSAKLIDNCGKHQLYIDCDQYYYTGDVNTELFPSEICNNYLEILTKSFTGYIDNTTEIKGYFENGNLMTDNMYIIDIVFTSTFYKNQKFINIPLTITKKDRIDYLENKIENLTKELSELKEIIANLTSGKSRLYKLSDIEISDDDDDDDDEEEEAPKQKVAPKVKKTVVIKSK
jgi:hypothetical protein